MEVTHKYFVKDVRTGCFRGERERDLSLSSSSLYREKIDLLRIQFLIIPFNTRRCRQRQSSTRTFIFHFGSFCLI